MSETECARGFQAATEKDFLPVLAAQTDMFRQLAAWLQLQCSMAASGWWSSLAKAAESPPSTSEVPSEMRMQ